MAAERRERATQFRLKNDDEGDGQERGEAFDKPRNHPQFQELRDEDEREKNQRESREHARAARAAQVDVAVVKDDREDGDLDGGPPVGSGEIEDGFQMRHGAAKLAQRGARGEIPLWLVIGVVSRDVAADGATRRRVAGA